MGQAAQQEQGCQASSEAVTMPRRFPLLIVEWTDTAPHTIKGFFNSAKVEVGSRNEPRV